MGASPTAAPSASPSGSPTASPSSSPTSSPTLSPTDAPSASPTFSPTLGGDGLCECNDGRRGRLLTFETDVMGTDEQYKQEQEPRNLQECKDVTGRFTVIGVGKRRCQYAKIGNRCAHEVQGGFTVADKCPETCEACPADEEEEDPIIIVTDPPTTSPVNDDTCEDIKGKFKVVGINKWKGCFWARRGNNCNRDLEEGGKVSDICPVTCDACPVTIVTDPPTKSPTNKPTSKPTRSPTSSPSSSPSSSPTSSPSSY